MGALFTSEKVGLAMAVRRFLAILEGSDPSSAAPVLATEDPEIIRATVEQIKKRLGNDGGGAPALVLPVGPQRTDADE